MEGRVAAMEGHRTCNYGREEMERQRLAGRTYDMRWISMRCTCALHVCARAYMCTLHYVLLTSTLRLN